MVRGNDLFEEPPDPTAAYGYDLQDEEEDSRPTEISVPEGDLSEMLVYVPAHPGYDNGEPTVRFELRHITDGPPVLIAFSSIDMLVEQLGNYQPWLSMSMDQLRETGQLVGIENIALNPCVQSGSGLWTEDDLSIFQES